MIEFPKELRIGNRTLSVLVMPEEGAFYRGWWWSDFPADDEAFFNERTDPHYRRHILLVIAVQRLRQFLGLGSNGYGGKNFSARFARELAMLLRANGEALDGLYPPDESALPVIPELLEIGDLVYEVLIVDKRLFPEGENGQQDLGLCRLVVSQQDKPEERRQTLLHEIIHAVLHGLSEEKLNGDENFVDTLAGGLDLFFQDNWEAVCGMFPEAFE